MYPLHTDNYTAATCYSLASDLLHHMHNINSAQLHSHQRAASLQISEALDLLMLAAIDSAARAAKKIDIMIRVAAAEECLDAAAAKLKAAVELGQAHPSESLGVVLRGINATLAAVHTLAVELEKEDVQTYWRGIEGDGYAEDEDGNPQIVYEVFECSNCGKEHHADGAPEWDYCPDCGARMDGEYHG